MSVISRTNVNMKLIDEMTIKIKSNNDKPAHNEEIVKGINIQDEITISDEGKRLSSLIQNEESIEESTIAISEAIIDAVQM